MKKEIALLLADALDSGHYIQSFGRNRRVDPKTGENTFCIGGVLVNLFAIAHPELAAKETDPERFMGTAADLPLAVTDWAGIRFRNLATRSGAPFNYGGHIFFSLQHANDDQRHDGRGMTFPQLAAWLRIEANSNLI